MRVMEITYASHHTWVKPVSSDPLAFFGNTSTTRIKALLRCVDTYNIHIVISPLDQNFLDIFLPLYVERITQKENPHIFDIAEKTLISPTHQHPYFSCAVFEGDTFKGGTIFSVQETSISIAYRVFDNEWIHKQSQAGPSLYAEYILALHAHTLGKETITHGKDRNPYGHNSSIGLALFKLAVGCTPKKAKDFEIHTLDTDSLTRDILILEYPGDAIGTIQKAYLCATEETLPKWSQVTKYGTQLQVEILTRE